MYVGDKKKSKIIKEKKIFRNPHKKQMSVCCIHANSNKVVLKLKVKVAGTKSVVDQLWPPTG